MFLSFKMESAKGFFFSTISPEAVIFIKKFEHIRLDDYTSIYIQLSARIIEFIKKIPNNSLSD